MTCLRSRAHHLPACRNDHASAAKGRTRQEADRDTKNTHCLASHCETSLLFQIHASIAEWMSLRTGAEAEEVIYQPSALNSGMAAHSLQVITFLHHIFVAAEDRIANLRHII